MYPSIERDEVCGQVGPAPSGCAGRRGLLGGTALRWSTYVDESLDSSLAPMFLLLTLVLLLGSDASRASAQGRYGLTAFGTERVTASQLRAEHADALESLLRLERADTVAFRLGREALARRLRAEGGFSYVHVELFRSYTDELDFVIDFVEPADSARRMAFRSFVPRVMPEPAGLLGEWRRYASESSRLFESGELRDMRCPVLHCTWSFHHERLQPFLDTFTAQAPRHVGALREVVAHDPSPYSREAAAFLLAHAGLSPDELIAALDPAIDDPSSLVRNAGLRVLYYVARAHPELQLPLERVIKALHFPSFTDRNKALVVLRSLPAERFSLEQKRSFLPLLLEVLRKGDAHNYRNAHVVLRQLSGRSHDAADIAAWATWVHEAMGGAAPKRL